MSFPKLEGLTVGKGCRHAGNIRIAVPPEGVAIGNFCAFGINTTIMGQNHDYNYPALQYKFYLDYFHEPHPINSNKKLFSKGKVVVGNDVWLGDDVFITAGVKIGDGCIVGARSVVTKDLPPYTVCVGTPCKPVKKRYSEDVIHFLTKLKWWNWDDDKIKRNKKFFFTDLNDLTVDQIKSIINQ